MKKRLLSIVLVLVLTMSMMTACGTKKDVVETETSGETVETSVEETATSEESAATEDLVVAFIYDGEAGDGGYTQAHDDGRLLVEDMEGVTTIYKESVSEDLAEVEKVCEDFIAQGATVIFGTSFGFMEGMLASAENHPDVVYEHCSGYMTADNMGTYFGKIYQMRYVTGMVAGLQTKTNKIGYVAAFGIPEVVRGINAFALGVAAVNPDAVVSVKWTSTWNDSAKEKDAASALIDEGVDVIAQHQNTVGAQTAAEEAGIWSIGYNKDMTYAAPTAHLTAPIWHWGVYYVDSVERVLAGTWEPSSWWGDATTGIVDIAPLSDAVPEETKALIEEAKAKVVSGETQIFVGPLSDNAGNVKVEEGVVMTDAELLSFDWFVSNVEGTIE